MFQIFSAPLSDPGRKRRNNEDWTAQFEPPTFEERLQSGCLYIVADGVGGAAKGERASQYAAQKVLYYYYHHLELPPAERLRMAMRQAGNEIYQYAEEQGEGRMATTMVAAVILGDKLIVANVGDSRAYLYRDGTTHQITRDHSLVGEMIRDGSMSEQESLHSKVKNSLTRSLGGELDTHVDLFEMDLQTGDRLLLSTDGLLRYTTRREIAAMLSTGTPREVAERMVSYALEQGGADNITVLPIEVGPRLEEGTLAAVGSMATPEPAEWELMATEAISPPMTAVAPKKRRKAWRKQQYYILYGLFGGITLTSLVMLGFFIFSNPKLDFAWLTNRVGTSTESVPVTNTIEPALAAVDVPLITETSTPMLTATETPTLLPTSTFTPTFTSTPILVTCVYQVQSGENLITILEGFGQVYNYCDEKYFYYLSCEELPDQANEVACTDQKRIRFEDDDVNCEQPDLQVNTWVEIKNVILEACVNGDEDGGGGGKILSEQTQ